MALEQFAFAAGRALFGLFFIVNGLNHFMKREMLTGYADAKGVPAPHAMVPLTGLLLLTGGISVLLGAYVTAGAGLLAVFLLVTTPTMHDFWAVGEDERMQEMTQFMKNTALLGAVLVTWYAWTAVQPWPYALNLGL